MRFFFRYAATVAMPRGPAAPVARRAAPSPRSKTRNEILDEMIVKLGSISARARPEDGRWIMGGTLSQADGAGPSRPPRKRVGRAVPLNSVPPRLVAKVRSAKRSEDVSPP